MHGVGHKFVQLAFEAFDLRPPFAVPEQKDPDPEFPTVKYPNPEEGKGVLVNIYIYHLSIFINIYIYLYSYKVCQATWLFPFCQQSWL